MSRVSVSSISRRPRAYRTSLLGMDELRKDWKRVAIVSRLKRDSGDGESHKRVKFCRGLKSTQVTVAEVM